MGIGLKGESKRGDWLGRERKTKKGDLHGGERKGRGY